MEPQYRVNISKGCETPGATIKITGTGYHNGTHEEYDAICKRDARRLAAALYHTLPSLTWDHLMQYMTNTDTI